MDEAGQRDTTESRRERILGTLSVRDQVSVAELSEQLNVSEVTVRKDLDILEREGLLTRVHGGAVMTGRGQLELFFAAREQQQIEQKRRIAASAAALVRPGQSIFLDASTTAFQIARLLKDARDLRVVTNGLYTALELTFSPGVTTIVVGGALRRRSSSLVGGLTLDVVERIHVDIGFFGARGITARHGLTESDIDEAQLKRQLVASSQTVIGIADATKFGTTYFSSFALPHEVDRIISDTGAPSEIVDQLRAREIVVDLV